MKNQLNSNLINKWHNYYFKLSNTLITEENIKEAFNSFLKEIINNFSLDFIIVTQFKIKTIANLYKSISQVQMDYIKNNKDILDMFLYFWTTKYDNFYSSIREDEYSYIIFTYKVLSNKSLVKPKKSNKLMELKKPINSKIKLEKDGYELPNTMDFHLWGEVILLTKTRVIVRKNSKTVYFINKLENKLNVEFKMKNKLILSFVDSKKENDNISTFTRIINGRDEYFYIDGEIKLFTKIKETPFLLKKEKEVNISDKFITMDLETRNINDELSPYCISTFDGKSSKSFYLLDYNNSEEMVIDCIKSLMRKKYNRYKIYLHNFSYFDGIFIIKILASLTDINLNPIIKDGRIINFPFRFKTESSKKYYVLYFRDSYLMLPSSLWKLSLTFHNEMKGIFPYKFVNNPNISLLYEGKFPRIKFFNIKEILEDEKYRVLYEKYKNSFKNKRWNLKNETIKYCEQDCIILFHIIKNFNKKIFNFFKINIHKYPTLSSLSLAIYRSNFLKKEYKIPLIQGKIYNNLKTGYTGGSVDVYKAHGIGINRYDVNSLYPFEMRNNPMPTGYPIYFEGDISLKENKPFGIFEVEITTPEKLDIPILQLRFKSDTGIKTLSPLGKWTSWYFSEELYNASKYGYEYKILRGYIFEKEYIFKDFVDFLYDLKSNSKKDTPEYIISKLLMNSLYGRFGMGPEMELHLILSSEEALKYYNNATNIIPLGEKELISFKSNPESENETLNISIPISIAVTSYGRIYMSKWKMMFLKLGITLFYSDTDSFDIDQLLDQIYVGRELGKLKLEHSFDQAVYLAPKVYGGINKDYEFVRIKGLKNPISFKELRSLLYKNINKKIKIPQEKWYRNFSDSKITIKKEIYTLQITENKRKLIYNQNNKFIETKPLVILNEKIIE